MCVPYGNSASIQFPNGTVANVTINVADDPRLTVDQFMIELQYPDGTDLWRICLEDEHRDWHSYLYSDGPWLVDRGVGQPQQQGNATPQSHDGITSVNTDPIDLITGQDDEWTGICSEGITPGIKLYFTMPSEGSGSFDLNEPDPSSNAFPLWFAIPRVDSSDLGEDSPPPKPTSKKRILIIWR